MRWIGVLVGLAGCGKLLSFDQVTYSPDAALTRVTGEYKYMFADIGSDLRPVVTELPAAADTEMIAMLPDGTRLPVDRGDDGTFAFSVPLGSPYRFALRDSDESVAQEYQTDQPTLTLRRRYYQRSDAILPTQTTQVTMNENPIDQNGFAAIASTGSRMYEEPGGINAPSLDWTGTGVGLLSGAHGDRLIYEHWHLGTTPSPYYTIIEDDVVSVDMVDGQPVNVGPDTPKALPSDRCVHLHVDATSEVARLHQGALDTAFAAWDIVSIPSAVLGPGGSQVAETLSSTPAIDIDQDIVYGTPFTGEADMSLLQIGAFRTLQVPNASPTTLQVIEYLYDQLSPVTGTSCPTNVVDVTGSPLALIDTATLDGTPLTKDLDAVMLDRTSPAKLEYTLTPGAHDIIVVSLVEALAVKSGGVTSTVAIDLRDFVGTGSIAIDPSLFVRNHYYLFQIQAIRGFPDHASMDFRNLTFPFGDAVTYSAMFRVAN